MRKRGHELRTRGGVGSKGRSCSRLVNYGSCQSDLVHLEHLFTKTKEKWPALWAFLVGKKVFDLISTYFGAELPTGTALELAGGGALLRSEIWFVVTECQKHRLRVVCNGYVKYSTLHVWLAGKFEQSENGWINPTIWKKQSSRVNYKENLTWLHSETTNHYFRKCQLIGLKWSRKSNITAKTQCDPENWFIIFVKILLLTAHDVCFLIKPRKISDTGVHRCIIEHFPLFVCSPQKDMW